MLYDIFIFPLEGLLSLLLDFLYSLTHSFGLAIILLSLCVNLFLLKLFFIADRAALDNENKKQRLDIKIAEFKRVFKGWERYAYIRTLYRQNHYHPIHALKALFGLILQIPFFLAVLNLLEFHSPQISHLSFWLIEDLSKPDSLLFGFNLLPLLMSALTLWNVFISSKSRLQGVIITLLFLILLYKMPSALLLYWTTSMAFALLKTLILRVQK